jgi:hypothetical protein
MSVVTLATTENGPEDRKPDPQPLPQARKRKAFRSDLIAPSADELKNQSPKVAAEASNPSLFVSGWRPAVGWICVCGFAYSIFAPVLHLPATDTNALIAILSGMLGLSTMRTVEKMGGKATTSLGTGA